MKWHIHFSQKFDAAILDCSITIHRQSMVLQKHTEMVGVIKASPYNCHMPDMLYYNATLPQHP